MRCKYQRKSVNISILSDKISDFFESKGFKTFVKKGVSHVIISVELEKLRFNRKIADVSLTSNADDSLTVEFESFKDSASVKMAPFFSLFGGGIVTLKNLNASEILDRLEKDFWEIVDGFMRSF